jgi:hypothetical protein
MSAAAQQPIGYVPTTEEMVVYLGIRLAGIAGPTARAGDAREEAALGSSIVAHMPPWLRRGPVVQAYIAFEMAAARLVAFLRAEREGQLPPVVTAERLAEAVEILDRWRTCMNGFREVSANNSSFSVAIPNFAAVFSPRGRAAQSIAAPETIRNYRSPSEQAVSAIAAHALLPPGLYLWAVATDPVAFASNPVLPVLAEADPAFIDSLPCAVSCQLLRAPSLPAAILSLNLVRVQREWQNVAQDRQAMHKLWLLRDASRLHVTAAGECDPMGEWSERLARWYRAEEAFDTGRRFRKIGRHWMLAEREPEQLASTIVTHSDWTIRLFGLLSSHLSPSGALGSRRIDILAPLSQDGNAWVRAAARRRLAEPRWSIDAFAFREEREIAAPPVVDPARVRAITALPPLPRAAAGT